MAGIRFGPTPRDAQQRLAQTSTLSFTADSGPLMAELAGEGLAKKRGNALHGCWMRPVHTSGVMVRGTFTPSREAPPGAPAYLTGGPLPVVARFSSCSADLQVNDKHVVPRGLAVQFELPDHRTTNLVSMSTDRFPVTTLSAFVSMSHAMSCHRPWRYVRLVWLGALHQARSPWTFLTAFSPISYARCDYYAIHTFVWPDAARQPVRYRWRATAGRKRPRPWTRMFKPRNYLEQNLKRLMGGKGVRFELEVQRPVGVDPDRLRDIARPLPRGIRWEHVGDLHLNGLPRKPEADELAHRVFSPAHLVDGVEPYPGDDVFAARAAAYPASHVFRADRSP